MLDGGDGWDAVSYGFATTGVTVNLATGVGSGGEAEGDTYISIEAIQATDANDTLIGDAADNLLAAYGGDDVLQGGDGDDSLYGYGGNDVMDGGAGNDTYAIYANDGVDTITDASGTADVIQFYQTPATELWFAQAGNNLVISHLGTTDKVTVNGWFSSPDNQIETIYDASFNTLNAGDVNNLISHMAQFSDQVGPDPSAVQPSQLPPEYNVAVNSVWHTAA